MIFLVVFLFLKPHVAFPAVLGLKNLLSGHLFPCLEVHGNTNQESETMR